MNKLWLGLGLGLLVISLWFLLQTRSGISVQSEQVGSVPVQMFIPQQSRGGVMVIAHGFAGSQQLMYPLATSLAKHGIPALTFDFPGHGQNGQPFDVEGNRSGLVNTLDQVVRFAQQRFPGEPVMLAGHSMGSAVVVEYGVAHPEIAATIGLSLVSDEVSPTLPKNLLILTGAWEFTNLKQAARQALLNATDMPDPQPGVTYGDPAEGTGRRLEWVPWTEHISILFASATLHSATSWADATLDQAVPITFTDRRMLWVALFIVGGLLVLWQVLALFSPIIEREQLSIGSWRNLLINLGPALLTPLALLTVPTDWMPMLLAGYVALFFTVYALIQWGLARVLGLPVNPWQGFTRISPRLWLIGAAVLVALGLLIGIPAQYAVMNVIPTAGRWPWIFVASALMLPYFVIDEALIQGGWRIFLARLAFIGSLFLSTILRPETGFLLLILPIFVLFFALMALIGGRLSRQTGAPFLSASITALMFGWFLCIALPYTGL